MKSEMKERIRGMTVPATCTVREAMQAIDRGALGMAILIKSGSNCFAGLVTDGDIRRALLSGRFALNSLVSQIPRPEPKTGYIEMSSEQLADLLNDPVRVVPLLDKDGAVADLAVLDRRVNIPVAEPHLGAKELLYVSECVLTGWVSSAGKFIAQFEEMFAAFCGTPYAIATSSGTSALHLAVRALDIGPGDEVIVPTLSFIATATAVTYTGARPVFVDSERETWNIDPELIEHAVTKHTKAIIPVHLFGHPANMDPILEIAARNGLSVIEDAAQAHGARYKNRCVGGMGTLGIFSFYGNKIITTGEGGMVVTDRADLAEKLRILRDHGMSSKRHYWHPVLGYNYRMTNLQAALGVAQLEKVGSILNAKKQIAQTYARALRGFSGISLQPKQPWAESVCWLYSILIDPKSFGSTRDELANHLKESNIESRPLFPPIHTQPVYATGQDLPIAQELSANGLSLPSAMGVRLEDINRVIDVIASVHAGSKR